MTLLCSHNYRYDTIYFENVDNPQYLYRYIIVWCSCYLFLIFSIHKHHISHMIGSNNTTKFIFTKFEFLTINIINSGMYFICEHKIHFYTIIFFKYKHAGIFHFRFLSSLRNTSLLILFYFIIYSFHSVSTTTNNWLIANFVFILFIVLI